MQDQEDQGVSDRKVSGIETRFLIFQRPNSKRHGLICTSLRRTSKKEETATTWLERGESSRGSLTAVGFTQRRPLPPPPSQRHSGRAVRHIHKQHLLSLPLFLRFIWQVMASVYGGQEETLHLKCDWQHTEIISGKETDSYSALHPWSSSIKWQGSSYYSPLSGTTHHHHLPFPMGRKRRVHLKDDIIKNAIWRQGKIHKLIPIWWSDERSSKLQVLQSSLKLI